MTEYNELIYNPPARLRLADGSLWGSEEITDLRNQFNQVKEQLDASRARNTQYLNRIQRVEHGVRDAFRELVEEDELDIDKANEHLESLNLDKLAVEWEFEAVLAVRGYIKAPDQETVEDALNEAGWSVENYSDDLEVNDFEVSEVSADRVMR